MSSREIADLTGKRHDHVMRDIRVILSDLGGLPKFGGTYRDTQGKEQTCFHLPKRESLIVVSGYSVELRARIIDRWIELENLQAAAPALPDLSDPAVLVPLLTSHATRTQIAESNAARPGGM